MTEAVIKNIKADAASRLKRAEKLVGDMKKLRSVPIFSPSPAPAVLEAARDAPVVTTEAKPAGLSKQQIVAAYISPSTSAAMAVKGVIQRGGELDLVEMAHYLKEGGVAAAGGDLSKLQEMLAIQSRTLDMVFNDFLVKASLQTNFDIKEKYIRLAFKAQSQCRATVESLAVIQQGPAIFARQANIANGPQQVNNGTSEKPSTTVKPELAMAARVENKE